MWRVVVCCWTYITVEFSLSSYMKTIRELLEIQQNEIDCLYTELNTEQLQNVIEQMMQTNSNIYFTGVGKSGGIASHTADMLKSMGYHAFYLSPINCLHG